MNIPDCIAVKMQTDPRKAENFDSSLTGRSVNPLGSRCDPELGRQLDLQRKMDLFAEFNYTNPFYVRCGIAECAPCADSTHCGEAHATSCSPAQLAQAAAALAQDAQNGELALRTAELHIGAQTALSAKRTP